LGGFGGLEELEQIKETLDILVSKDEKKIGQIDEH